MNIDFLEGEVKAAIEDISPTVPELFEKGIHLILENADLETEEQVIKDVSKTLTDELGKHLLDRVRNNLRRRLVSEYERMHGRIKRKIMHALDQEREVVG